MPICRRDPAQAVATEHRADMTGRRKADFRRVTGRWLPYALATGYSLMQNESRLAPGLRPPPEYQGSSRRAPVRQVGVCDPGVHASIAGVAIDCEWAEVGGRRARARRSPHPLPPGSNPGVAPSPQGEAFPRRFENVLPLPPGDGFAARFGNVLPLPRERDGVRAFPALTRPPAPGRKRGWGRASVRSPRRAA